VKGTISYSKDGGGNQNSGNVGTFIERIVWDVGHVTRNGDVSVSSARRAVLTRKISRG